MLQWMSYKEAVEIMAWWENPNNHFKGRFKVRQTLLAERVVAAKKNAKLIPNEEKGEGLPIEIDEADED